MNENKSRQNGMLFCSCPPSPITIWHAMSSEMLFRSPCLWRVSAWVTIVLLSTRTSLLILVLLLSPTRHFLPHNQHSLDKPPHRPTALCDRLVNFSSLHASKNYTKIKVDMLEVCAVFSNWSSWSYTVYTINRIDDNKKKINSRNSRRASETETRRH